MKPPVAVPRFGFSYVLALWLLLLTGGCANVQTDPLSAWNDGKVKQDIVGFVAKVTTQGSPDYVPVAERIATFDNDGTLWIDVMPELQGARKALVESASRPLRYEGMAIYGEPLCVCSETRCGSQL